MKRVCMAALLVLAAGAARADVIAYWAFPATVPASADNFKISFPLAADQKITGAGPAQITTDGAVWDGSAAPANSVAQGNYQYLAGDTTNRLDATWAAGSSLAVRGNTNNIANGTSVTFRFDTTSYQDIVMTWAERVTTTGASSLAVSTSTDGTTFTPQTALDFAPLRDGNFHLRTLDLSAVNGIENVPSAYVRLTFSGFNGATGGYRFDNVQVKNGGVPAPASFALMGLGGLVAARRRR